MRSKAVNRILARTPEETRNFVRLYTDLVVRIHQVMKAKGLSQSDLARKMDKRPSEISKWLNGEHNLTLKTIARLEAELGVELISIPAFLPAKSGGTEFKMTVVREEASSGAVNYAPGVVSDQFDSNGFERVAL